jgi:hypothetical protein
MEIALVLLLLGSTPTASGTCAYDSAAFLRLDQRSFDQEPGEGWRSLEARGCYEAAADSIASYRRARDPESTSLYFHEAQMRAYAGDYAAALDLLPFSRHRLDYFGWNAYVDATAAFLRRDINALIAAREDLLRTPTPDSHRWFDENGEEIPAFPWTRGDPWPQNLRVVDALICCFGRTYREAYSSADCAVRQ